MKINSSKKLFLSTMIMSTIMMISSNNMLMMWVSMEINMIAFLPMMTKSKKLKDQPMKYFIVQSVSSSIMLMSIMINSTMETAPGFSIMLMTSMLMKTGMMPFHLWLPNIMEKLSWENCMIISTIQKIPPTIIITQLISLKMMLMSMMLSSVMAPITALKQLSTKKIMAYSSISNSSWMILSMYNSKQLFWLFMLIYSMLTMSIMNKMKMNNIMYTNQMSSMNKMTKLSMTISILSLSGIPPLLGFLPKWIILQNSIEMTMILTITLVISSTISSFIYMKMSSTMMMMKSATKKNKKEKNMKNYDLILNTMGIPMMMSMKF
uniref:NADH-ubiquinone oxidoreductase chain 2 n=1 Tax=Hemisphaerius rufovarius TaxID=1897809 RepID=A0A6M4AHF5_9HEMI|nr:NADH dehydrogenase subunit 2 [Hemisphaerius rufovarius]